MPNDLIELIDLNGNLYTNPFAIHAEDNLFRKLIAHGTLESAAGSTIYITLSPCMVCCPKIITAKVARVCFRNIYRDDTSIITLRDAGIIVDHKPFKEQHESPTSSTSHAL